MNYRRKRDLMIAPVCEAALILIASVAAWLTQQPLIFASLGPTAYELIETPHRKSARPYNIIAGHLIAVVCGFASLSLTRAWWAPAVSNGHVRFPRVEAAVVSAGLTVLVTLLLRATQPAAISTTLLISLGLMQQWKDGVMLMVAVLLMTMAGEPMRRWRLHHVPDEATLQENS
ncbi:MAG TPA: HPP family protein [Candidatus Aquilonibacter sp.]|nr:HPP family protein [Candidatus Aquilonibacter sp.]